MSLKHKTFQPRKEDMAQKWYEVDANGKTVGRLAAAIAQRLRGKHLPSFAPHADPQVHVVVTNASGLVFTGDKMKTKSYFSHSQYPGGLKEIKADKLQIKKPGEILRHAVKGMLPHNRLSAELMKNLRIFGGPIHNHQGQMPEKIEIKLK